MLRSLHRTWIWALVVSVGCTTSMQSKARINDVSVRPESDAGYNVTAVDGKPVVRAKGEYKTTVPMALVDPGAHVFSIAHRVTKAQTELRAEVAPGVQYRIAVRPDGSPTLVPEGAAAGVAGQTFQPAAVSEKR